ncbi:hypothetical protein LIER_31518 [Lithospermum erythrorhizon]|uniref:Reverse transcriptase Ty1/copia-type domain-containing protein n=1 Tax=Lithospermum erythrorhizon TaxID=34254 RepID=A0AAV3RUD0_LITER
MSNGNNTPATTLALPTTAPNTLNIRTFGTFLTRRKKIHSIFSTLKAVGEPYTDAGLKHFLDCQENHSLFTYKHDGHTLYFLLYVDDIIFTGSSIQLLTSFIAKLNTHFVLTDLGELHYFLGIEVVKGSVGLLLSQRKYANDLLQKYHMQHTHSIATPSSLKPPTLENASKLMSAPHEYRSLVSGLQGLTLLMLSIQHHNSCIVLLNHI